MGSASAPVLITGGSGFIGTYLTRRLLVSGRKVCIFDIRPPTRELDYVLGDLRDRVDLRLGGVDNWPRLFEVVRDVKPDCIVHGAAIVDPAFLKHAPLPALRVNVEGTVNVLEATRLLGVRRMVYLSSIGLLTRVQYEPIDVNHPILIAREGPGAGFYGAAKAASEVFCYAYHDAFGVDFRAVRPSGVYGFGMGWPMFVKPMVEAAVEGRSLRFATGGPFPRSYTHVEDVASLIACLIDAPDDVDRIFYAATGERLTTATELAAIVRDVVPGADIEIGDTLGPDDNFELSFRAPLSIENARQQLGWEPRFRSMRDGVAEYVARYREYVGVGPATSTAR
ncbi:MAG: NAD(P)-dependent oxidoreductase [Candidatus Limnocylindrales bacterium]